MLELLYFTWIYYVTRPFRWYQHFWTLTSKFGLFSANFDLAIHFWTVSARALIFHMSILCDKTFPWVTTSFTLTLEFDIFSENFSLAINFWTVTANALIFHLSTTCDKTFLQIPTFLYWYQGICPCELCHLWNWPLSGAFVFHTYILFLLWLIRDTAWGSLYHLYRMFSLPEHFRLL